MIFLLLRKKVFHINIYVFVYDCYLGLIILIVILFRTQQCGLQFSPPTLRFSYLVFKSKCRLLRHILLFSTAAYPRLEEEKEKFPSYVSHPSIHSNTHHQLKKKKKHISKPTNFRPTMTHRYQLQ